MPSSKFIFKTGGHLNLRKVEPDIVETLEDLDVQSRCRERGQLRRVCVMKHLELVDFATMLTMVGVQSAIRRRGLLRDLRPVYEVLDACGVSERVDTRSGCSIEDASESAASDVPSLVPERDVQFGKKVVEPASRDVAKLVSGAFLHGRVADEM